jgi:hypothetical protein
MHASFMKAESNHRAVMWEVRDGSRWWTVAFLTEDGSYYITSDNGREIKPDGPLGRKIIAATKESPR